MKSKAKTVKEYVAELPEDRRPAIEAVRKVILANLDKEYEETMCWGVAAYVVPQKVFPEGHHTDRMVHLLELHGAKALRPCNQCRERARRVPTGCALA